jgi:hypothetical protein
MIHMHYLFRFAENNLWRARDGLPGLPTHIELPRAKGPLENLVWPEDVE